jgi:hypothetical protein
MLGTCETEEIKIQSATVSWLDCEQSLVRGDNSDKQLKKWAIISVFLT